MSGQENHIIEENVKCLGTSFLCVLWIVLSTIVTIKFSEV